MSLLDDARRLLKIQPLENEGTDFYCRVCGEQIDGYPDFNGHAPDCPWLAMPQIVAALEAAEAVTQEWDHAKLCPFCGPRLQRRPLSRHYEVCPYMALVAALKGNAP